MRLTTKSEYAVRSILHLTFGKDVKAVQIREISDNEGISKAYIEQLFNKMRKYGLIKSQRGPSGGYVLAKAPEKITIGDIVRSVEGPISLTHCTDKEHVACKRAGKCKSYPMWKKINRKVEEVLDSTSLGDLL